MKIEETIKENNYKINQLIRQIIQSKKENCVIEKDDGEFEIEATYKKILTMEIKKMLKIYQAEFPYLNYDEVENIEIFVEKGDFLDCHGYKQGVSINSGSSKYLANLSVKYRINENGRIISDDLADRTDKIKCDLYNQNNGTPYFLEQDETIENNSSIKEFLAYFYLNNCKDIDFMLDALPHETMHMFGFKGGIHEGTTEEFTRETVAKYGIRCVPMAHPEETIRMQKIEKIIGKRAITEGAFSTDTSNSKPEIISNAIDNRIAEIEPSKVENLGLFYKYAKADEKYTSYLKKNRKIDSTSEKLKEEKKIHEKNFDKFLNNYVCNHKDKLYELVEEPVLSIDEQEKKNSFLSQTLSLQEKELEELEKIFVITSIKNKQEEKRQLEEQIEQIKNSIDINKE